MKPHRCLILTTLSLTTLAFVGCGPNLKATDPFIDFGDTFVGTPVTRSVAWVNHGGEAHIGKVELTKSDAFDLDASEIDRDPELSRNERSGDVSVTFAPKRVGVETAKLKLDSNGKEQDVSLRGRGVYTLSATAVSLSGDGLRWDEPLDHGSIPVAGGEAIRRIRVTNRTNDPVTVDLHWARGQQGFALRGNDEDFRLDPGDSRELAVVFDPEDSGSFQDTLVLAVDDSRVDPRSSVTRTRGGVVVVGKGTR